MAENKELARLEARVFDSDKYMAFETQVNGSENYIIQGLTKLINCVADNVGVSDADLLALLALLCGAMRMNGGAVSINMGDIERAMGKED